MPRRLVVELHLEVQGTAPVLGQHAIEEVQPVRWEPLNANPNDFLLDPAWHLGLPDSIIADIKASIARPGELPYYQITPARRPTLKRKFDQLREAGLVLLIGTDSGVPLTFHSLSTWQELDLWVRVFGVDPMVTIRAATYWPSVMMGVSDEVGTISPGKYADLIAVKGDVLRYINLLQDVDLVIKHGRRYK